MKNVFRKILVALLAIVWGASAVQAQSVNMDRYITLTVKQGAAVLINMTADADNTPVKIVSGTEESTVTVGTKWIGQKAYIAGSTTMTVYGDVQKFDCNDNMEDVTELDASHNDLLTLLECSKNSLTSLDVSKNTQLMALQCSDNFLTSLDVSSCTKLRTFGCYNNSLTSLDVSKNTELKILYCFANKLTSLDVSKNTQLMIFNCQGNKFTTETLDDLFCSLPSRKGLPAGKVAPVSSSSSPDNSIVLAANGNNAASKNWKVVYFTNNAQITGFTGTKECENVGSGVNMDRYITLTATSGDSIKLDIAADAAGTQVKISSGGEDQTITVGTAWTGMKKYAAKAETITVYGNVKQFNCGKNGNKITGLDVSNNTQLVLLYCEENAISSLDISKNAQLAVLDCYSNNISSLNLSNNKQLSRLSCYRNNLTSLDVSNNTLLTFLSCHTNKLTSLDVSKNTNLTILNCRTNQLNAIDVSNNTKLEWLYCFSNELSSLDVSKNTNLSSLYCYGNNFTTTVLDDIYCSLPDRKGKSEGRIDPAYNASSPDKDKVLASNGNNAISRNWKIQYYENDTDITGFTGTHQCTSDIDEAGDVPSFGVYPNPVKDILHITSDKPVHSIQIYNVYGMEVLYATDVMSINVSHLPAGVYIVRADSKVTRIIKE